ncbi:hypothetical protein N7499_010239 [Penicillium canescens]|nr:hypothetical protein N7522_000637 [Penicillium canescens]KAJ6034084.1 hypothetical protein N7444_011855 [Penicillium canescens]KAJ6072225.1 hypothetical protein N7499_010239 [Penicillium canescens]
MADGAGAMVFSPISEIPAVGRNPPYVITVIIFAVLWIPTALVENFGGLLVLRFLTGFFGSPCLATGGAKFGDICQYLLVIWAGATVLAPALGPIIGNFSATAENWRWVSWEMLWLSGPICGILFFSLPETSSSTILYYRARRLRKLTGNTTFKSQAEIDQAQLTTRQVVYDALIKPTEINILDPAVLYSTIYTSLVYGISYSFFESFPLVGQLVPAYIGLQL